MSRGVGDLFPSGNIASGPASVPASAPGLRPGTRSFVPQPAALLALQRLMGAQSLNRQTQAQLAQTATPPGYQFSDTVRTGAVASSRSFRGQSSYPPAPVGFHDEEFVHFYDAVSTPALGLTLAPGAVLRDVVLPIETDAAFLARGIQVIAIGADVQFREPSGRYLSPGFLDPDHSYVSAFVFLPAGTLQVQVVPLEPEIYCPAGSLFYVFFRNPLPIPVALTAAISIFGVKRYANCA